MKKIAAAGLLVIGITITTAIVAQSIKNDPTYSVNNYKQPNKAKEARGVYGKNMIHFKTRLHTSGNYKQQNNNATQAKEELNYVKKGEQNHNALTNPGNYKTHH